MNFGDLVINGLPLMVIILGLVETMKKFGVSGNALFASSLLLGTLFGVLYQLSAVATPVGFGQWLGVIVFGLSVGLSASGIFDVIKSTRKPL